MLHVDMSLLVKIYISRNRDLQSWQVVTYDGLTIGDQAPSAAWEAAQLAWRTEF